MRPEPPQDFIRPFGLGKIHAFSEHRNRHYRFHVDTVIDLQPVGSGATYIKRRGSGANTIIARPIEDVEKVIRTARTRARFVERYQLALDFDSENPKADPVATDRPSSPRTPQPNE